MSGSSSIWTKLSKSKKYRESVVASIVKRLIPMQIRVLRKQRGWSQSELATQSNVTQGVISRAEDPDYGNLTINTLVRVAAGFDCAFLGRFVPFSELTQWYDGISNERSMEVASFSDDISPMNHQSDLAPAQQQLDLTKAYRTSTYYLGNMSGNFRSQPLPAKFMALHQSERRYGTRRVA